MKADDYTPEQWADLRRRLAADPWLSLSDADRNLVDAVGGTVNEQIPGAA